MDDLIEALQILSKYTDLNYPIGCEYDILSVWVDPKLVSRADRERLDELGFAPAGTFSHFRYYC